MLLTSLKTKFTWRVFGAGGQDRHTATTKTTNHNNWENNNNNTNNTLLCVFSSVSLMMSNDLYESHRWAAAQCELTVKKRRGRKEEVSGLSHLFRCGRETKTGLRHHVFSLRRSQPPPLVKRMMRTMGVSESDIITAARNGADAAGRQVSRQ